MERVDCVFQEREAYNSMMARVPAQPYQVPLRAARRRLATTAANPNNRRIWHDVMPTPATDQARLLTSEFLKDLAQQSGFQDHDLYKEEPKKKIQTCPPPTKQQQMTGLVDDFLMMFSQTGNIQNKRQNERQWKLRENLNKRKIETKILPVNIFDQYVKCHVTNNSVPKFVKKRSAVPNYAILEVNNSKSFVPESTWVQKLEINKAPMTEQEKFAISEIMENHEITTEVLLQKLDSIHGLDDEIHDLKHQIKRQLQNCEFLIKKENEYTADAQADPRDPEIIEQARILREGAEKKLGDQKQKIKNKVIEMAAEEIAAKERGFKM